MSSPIHNGDKLGALELYAPPWVREQTSPSAVLPSVTVRQQPPSPQDPAEDLAEVSVPQPESTWSRSSTPPPSAVPPDVQARTEVSPAAAAVDRSATLTKENDPYCAASLWPDMFEAPQAQPESALHMEPSNLEPSNLEPSGRLASAAQPRLPKGVGGPNLDWRAPRIEVPAPVLRSKPSEGKAVAKVPRRRLLLEPGTIPEPPIPQRQKSLMPLLGRLGLLTVFAATVAYAITFYSIPETRLASVKPDTGIQDQITVGAANSSQVEATTLKQFKMRMVIEGRQAFVNEAIPLGVSLIGTPNGEFVLLSGLMAGTKVSVGTASGDTGWRLAVRDLSTAVAFAPKDYVGVMNAAVDLRTSNDAIIDRNVMRLEWVAKQPDIRPEATRGDGNAAEPPGLAVQSLGKEEIATLLRRGAEYMKGGDIAAARLVLQRAVSSGDPESALALGATYDPYVFGELGVLGFSADAVQARVWYERAAKLGVREATQRIDRLAKLGR
jgi:hypothetical protein